MASSWISDRTPKSSSYDRKPVAGLCNLGNTCFFNSALQLLNVIRPISYPIDLNACIPDGFEANEDMIFYRNVIEQLKTLFCQLKKKRMISNPLNPAQLLRLMANRYEGIVHGVQGDAHEVLTLALDAIIRGTNRNYSQKCEYYDPSSTDTLEEVYAKSHAAKLKGLDSPFEQYVETTEISRTRCSYCSHTSVSFQHGIGLSLPLPSHSASNSDPATISSRPDSSRSPREKANSLTHVIAYIQTKNQGVKEVRFSIPTKHLHVDCIYRELTDIFQEMIYHRLIDHFHGINIHKQFSISAYSYEFAQFDLDNIVRTILDYYHKDDEEYLGSAVSMDFSPCSDSEADGPNPDVPDIDPSDVANSNSSLRLSNLRREPHRFTPEELEQIHSRMAEFSKVFHADHLIIVSMMFSPTVLKSRDRMHTSASQSAGPTQHFFQATYSLCINPCCLYNCKQLQLHDSKATHEKPPSSDELCFKEVSFCSNTLLLLYNTPAEDVHASHKSRSSKEMQLSPKFNAYNMALEILIYQLTCYLSHPKFSEFFDLFELLLKVKNYGVEEIPSKQDPNDLSIEDGGIVRFILKEEISKQFINSLYEYYKGKDDIQIDTFFANYISKLFEPITGLLNLSCHTSQQKERPIWSLSDCFAEYVKITTIEGWRCGVEDHPNPSGENGSMLYKAPPYLILHLKRFDQVFSESGAFYFTKRDDNIRYPHILDITPYTESKSESHGKKYMLNAVICHMGGTNYGHYFAYILSRETGDWWEVNDETVHPISRDATITPAAYILLYRRISSELDCEEKKMRHKNRTSKDEEEEQESVDLPRGL